MHLTEFTRRSTLSCAVLLVFLALMSTPSSAAKSSPSKLHAAMIFRLASFVEWSDGSSSDGPFRVAVLGAEEVADELERLSQTRKLGGRVIEVTSINTLKTGREFDLCFVGDEIEGSVDTLLAQQTPNLLTMSNTSGFAKRGGMIQLITLGGRKVKFEVNRSASEQAGLRISSRLLELAAKVHSADGEK